MILSVERAKWLIDFKDWPIERIEQKLKAIEQTIRSYTNNNFQNRKIRSAGVVSSSKLNVINKLYGLSIGDTVQITESMFKAETLSRHSVTYFDQDASNQMNGYPVSLLGCLKPYRKARC